MQWISRLFRKRARSATEPSVERDHRIPTVRMPSGYPDLETFRKPGARGESNIPRAKDKADYNRRMRRRFAQMAEFNRKRSIAAGITEYVWMASAQPCDIALENDGKRFSYIDPPACGHPCEGQCNSPDWCRCLTRPVVAGFG